MISILLLDDDESYLNGLKRLIELEGFEVSTAVSLDQAKALFLGRQFELAILDANLLPSSQIEKIKSGQLASGAVPYVPEEGAGFAMAAWIREKKTDTGIIVLTSEKIDPQSRIRGFECGSDDYIIKNSITNDELIWRIKSILRRGGHSTPATYRHWKFTLTPEAKIIETNDGRQLELNETQINLLKYLFMNPYIVFDRSKLSQIAYGRPNADARSIDNLISKTRKQIEETLGIELPLQTIRGRGYELK